MGDPVLDQETRRDPRAPAGSRESIRPWCGTGEGTYEAGPLGFPIERLTLAQWGAVCFAIVVVLLTLYGVLWEFMDAAYRQP